ncbi:hypothetical protein OAN80_05500, partial [Alphaproteobacteria bacterium]|nr:hypothetical protein [Alphaproteobacteria bacterium]
RRGMRTIASRRRGEARPKPVDTPTPRLGGPQKPSELVAAFYERGVMAAVRGPWSSVLVLSPGNHGPRSANHSLWGMSQLS